MIKRAVSYAKAKPLWWLTGLLAGQWPSADGLKMARVLEREEKKSWNTGTTGRCSLTSGGSESHRGVAPLPGEIFWLRGVRHPGRAAVGGRRGHDEVVRVPRTVGWYSVDSCYWVSCKTGGLMTGLRRPGGSILRSLAYLSRWWWAGRWSRQERASWTGAGRGRRCAAAVGDRRPRSHEVYN